MQNKQEIAYINKTCKSLLSNCLSFLKGWPAVKGITSEHEYNCFPRIWFIYYKPESRLKWEVQLYSLGRSSEVHATDLCILWTTATWCQAADLLFDYQPIKLIPRAACFLELDALYGHWLMLLINCLALSTALHSGTTIYPESE